MIRANRITWLCSLILLLLVAQSLASTPAQIIEDPLPEEIQAEPVEIYDDYETVSLNLSQGHLYHPLTTLLTGPGFFHKITVKIEDDIDRTFGSNDLFQITYNLDLISTIFDPAPQKITLEDGNNGTLMLDLPTKVNDQLNLTSTVLSIAEQTTQVNMTTRLQTYFVQPQTYNFEETSYTIHTLPLQTQYAANESFSWRVLEPTHILLDENLQLNQSYDIELVIDLEIESSTEEDATIRLEVGGDAASYNMQEPAPLRIGVPIASLYELKLSTLSGYIEFEIASITIDIDPYNIEDEVILPDLPRFGWVMGVLLYAVSLLMVHKFMKVRIEMEEEV